MSSIFDHPARSYRSADAAFRGVLGDLLEGASSTGPISTGAEKVRGGTAERLAYRFVLEDMRSRIVACDLLTLNLKVAAARFVWMISGNSRLADITFYEPNAGAFTDDGIVMPGSSYGHRMRYSVPGVDQIAGVIDRVRNDVDSRRAPFPSFSLVMPCGIRKTSRACLVSCFTPAAASYTPPS